MVGGVGGGVTEDGDSWTTHAIFLTDSLNLLQKLKSGMGNPDWNVSMLNIHLRKLPVGVQAAQDLPE